MIRAANNQKSLSPDEQGVRLPPAGMYSSGIRSKKNSTSRNKKIQLHEHAFRSQQVDSTSEVRLGSKLASHDNTGESKMILYESKEINIRRN